MHTLVCIYLYLYFSIHIVYFFGDIKAPQNCDNVCLFIYVYNMYIHKYVSLSPQFPRLDKRCAHVGSPDSPELNLFYFYVSNQRTNKLSFFLRFRLSSAAGKNPTERNYGPEGIACIG